MLEDSKEAIISKMIQTASGLWGYADKQDLGSFDPLVAMLFSTMAEQLFNLRSDIKKTDARLVEKLYELVFNQHELTHSPAHALIRANPLQARTRITGYDQFIYQLKVPKTIGDETIHESKDIGFTPTIDGSLLKIEPRYVWAGQKLYGIKDRQRELVAETVDDSVPDRNRLCIGLYADNLLDKLDGLSFMFSASSKLTEERLCHYLAGSRWAINGVNLGFSQGIDAEVDNVDLLLQNMLKREYSASYRVCRFINEYYRARFFTVHPDNYMLTDLRSNNTLYESIKRCMPANVADKLADDLLWLEIEFPQPIPHNLLQDMNVMTNCFPVVNRRLNEFSCSLSRGMNVVPLSTQELFFDVDRVTDSQGKLYKSLTDHGNGDEEGFFLRQGGVARFDSRDAVEMIRNMIELVRDERAGFSVLGADMIASELKQLDQIINRLQNRLDASKERGEAASYLLLRCKPDFERAMIRFWTTNGEEANHIRSDSRVSLQRGSDLDRNSIVFVSNTMGGRQKLTGEQKKNKLRRSLLSRGRVVTREDIKALCLEEFGDNLKKVEVSHGKFIDPDPARGFMRSIDVHLFLKKNTRLSEDEQNEKVDTVKVRLSQESVNLLPYRVFVKK